MKKHSAKNFTEISHPVHQRFTGVCETRGVMRIRLLPLVIGGAGLVLNALGQSPESTKPIPTTGMATVSLAELKALWEKSQEKPPALVREPEPPVAALLQELDMEITLHPERCTGVVKAKAAALKSGWHQVSLFGGDLSIDSSTVDALVLAEPGDYFLMLENQGSKEVSFQVSLTGTNHWTDEDRPTIQLSPATLRRVLFKGVPEGMVLVDCERVYTPSAEGEVLLSLRPFAKSLVLRLLPAKGKGATLPGIELAQATIPLLKCTQRIVMDGGLLTEAEFSIKHQTGTPLVIALPAGADLLRCVADGAPLRPERRENEIVLELAPPSSQDALTTLQLTCFTKLEPIQQTSGSLKLSVPVIALFHERLEWTIALPEGITAAALDSNAASATAIQGSRELQLKRELWKGDRVTAEIFYQKQKP